MSSDRVADLPSVYLPSAVDYTRIQILVHPLADLDPLVLNRVLQRLRNAEVIEVSENPLRLARAKFVTAVGEDARKFGEFQTFRKIFGVICIGAIKSELLNQRRLSSDKNLSIPAEETEFYESLRREYDEVKAQHNTALVSQCILFDCDNATQFDTHELLAFPRLDDASELEMGVRELIRSVYIVLESRRINNAFEKLETPSCPTLVDEEKYSVGTDNHRSKSYRRKCIGRNRKILADYALLTGLPTLALDAYDAAIDYLEQVSDYLWLAAALEGWSCAALLIKFKDKFDQISNSKSIIRRVSTVDNAQYMQNSHNHQRRERLAPDGASTINVSDLTDTFSSHTLATTHHHRSSCQLAVDDVVADESPGQLGKSAINDVTSRSEADKNDNNDSNHSRSENFYRIKRKDKKLYVELSEATEAEKLTDDDNEDILWPTVQPQQFLRVPAHCSSRSFLQYFSRHSSSSSMSLYSDNRVGMDDGRGAIRRYGLKSEAGTYDGTPEITSNVSLTPSATRENGAKASAPTSPTAAGLLSKRQNLAFSHEDIVKRFAQALDNYAKFSFAATAQSDCIVRNVDVFILRRAFNEAEAFIHERMAVLLDDKFSLFDNRMKAHICLICAAVCSKIGFRRKNAFYMRLSVLFQLNVASTNNVSDANDYKSIYPLLYRSLRGYGLTDERVDLAGGRRSDDSEAIFGSNTFAPIPRRSADAATSAGRANVPFAIQIKAVSEVFISASRAGLYDVAIRHICFILQNYFDYMGMDDILEKNAELQKLVELHGEVHSLAQPISLFEQNIVLPPVELTRFPRLGELKICPLPAHLAPTIADSEASKIFIYSPFQDRKKQRDVLWVVDCLCEVLISVSNPLPIDLIVKNLTLIVSGCRFEANPIRLNLPSCYGAEFSPRATPTVKITGVPKHLRSAGTLTITGYSCEVLGVKTVCSLSEASGGRPSARPTVRVLDALPLMALETSLRMTPTADASIAEATVFSGQMLYHSIHLHNTSEMAAIECVSIKIQQPEVCGGPNLVDVLHTIEVRNIAPGERRELRIKIFGIDPSANPTQQGASAVVSANGGQAGLGHSHNYSQSSASNGGHTPNVSVSSSSNLLGEEHRVYVRRNTSVSIVPSETSDTASVYSMPHSTIKTDSDLSVKSSVLLPATNNDKATPPMTIDAAALSNVAEATADKGHDLIPYIGRLLSAEFIFTYTMAVSPTEHERCERVARLPLAVAIVPALNVVDWHILAGDGPLTRYVVVDVTNATDVNAELTYGGDGRMMWVQPKEICRVPLLCPCCTDISSLAFTAATQLESHMMQMREIERLRKMLEKHIARYLDIRWSIPALNLEGLVPVGSLLSSVAFLKQLVVPEVSISITVNDSVYVSEDDVVVGIGELIRLKVSILASIKEANVLSGVVNLHCYQDLQNSQLQQLNRDENIILYGPTRIPFRIPFSESSGGEKMRRFDATFSFAFRYEGVHKIRPLIADAECSAAPLRGTSSVRRSVFNDEMVFVPFASFNVVTKA